VTTVAPVAQLVDRLDSRTAEILERRRESGVIRRRGWLVRRALLLADVVGLSAAFLVAQQVYLANTYNPGSLSRATEFVVFAFSLPIWIIGAKLYGLYDKDEERADHSTAGDFERLFHMVTVCTFLLYALSHATRWFSPEFSKLFLFWLLAIIFTVSLRGVARTWCRRQLLYLQNTIIVGAGDVGQSVGRKFLQHPEYGINLVGFVDSDPKDREPDLSHVAVLGGPSDLSEIVRALDVDRVVIAFSGDGHEAVLALVNSLRAMDVQIDIVPRLFENLGPSIGIHSIEGVPLVSLPPGRLPRSSVALKRALDLGLAAVAFIVLLPLLIGVAIAVKVDSKGPVLYRHKRVGRGGRTFHVIKFRTMLLEACRGDSFGGDAAEDMFAALMSDPNIREEFETNYKLQNDPRVTRIGNFLRRTSIDELPQFINVVRGDMSLVGPRALTPEEIDRYYGDSADAVLAIRPGITGYWQVNGRSRLAYEDRVRLDLAYVGGWSLALDLGILFRTVKTLFGRAGAY
jgi:exopolysaccharide biosynthesis polyprenyl glycosylphosphotransferase